MLDFGCDWVPSMVGLWDFMDEMVKIWHLGGFRSFDIRNTKRPKTFNWMACWWSF
jgi:hypothetical protein